MRILVYDVAAENGGAVTVLNWFYGIHKEDKENQYVYRFLITLSVNTNC